MRGNGPGNRTAARPTTTDCRECPLRRLDTFIDFPKPLLEFLVQFKMGEVTLDRGAPLVSEGAESPHLYTVLSGWLFRYKTLEDGRRQILNFALPGDFIGLQGSVFDAMDHSIEALTPVRLCIFARDRIWEVYRNHPGLGYSLTWLAARSERMLDEQLLSIGARTASERMAHVLLCLYERAEQLALLRNRALALPITRQHLAEALGLSVVHTTRTLRSLKSRGLLCWAHGVLTIEDRDGLAELAKLDAARPEGRRPLL